MDPTRPPTQARMVPPAPSRPAEIHPPAPRPGDMPTNLFQPATDVDAYLSAYLDSVPMAEDLRTAIRYSLLGPGKRARPVLAWHASVAVGGTGPASLPGGGAVEFIHAFSLVHDDLPAMDDDDLRRGRPTLHKHTNEAMAILAGDEMLNLGYRLITERVHQPVLVGKLCHELAIGTSGMISGQVYDSLGGMPASLNPLEKLQLIHRNKTGALIRAACRMGALCGLAHPRSGVSLEHGFDLQAMDSISTYADAIGLMFQIVDDILDVTQSAEHMGKKTGKDQEAGKLTYPGVIGLDRSNAEVERLLDVSKQALCPLGSSAAPLLDLAQYMAVRTR